jgi:large subunit ribosomal protein L5
MTPRLLIHYRKKVIPALEHDLKTKNIHAVPRVTKVVLNAGFGNGVKDPKLQETMVSTLTRISGQKPLLTKSKKSISAFKIRAGMTIGAKVTLRGTQMYEFLDKLINVTLPRVRDFRGVSVNAFDRQGNYTLGFREHLSFPEIHSDEVEKIHGLEVIIATTAKDPIGGRALLEHLGFPFRDTAVSAKAQTAEQLLSKKQLVVKKKDK